MPAAIPAIAGAAAGFGATSLAVSAGIVAAGSFGAAIIGGIASFATQAVLGAAFNSNEPEAPDPNASLNAAGAGRTQQVRQPIAPMQIGFGRYKTSGPILFVHTDDDDEGRANGYLYLIHGLAGVHLKAINDVYLGDDLSTASQFSGLVRVGKHLGATDQVADADLVSEIPSAWTTDHRLRGIAYTATRLKWNSEAYPSGIPNIAAVVDGNDEIYDPR